MTLLVCSVAAAAGPVHASPCPPPTWTQGDQCVLRGDEVLDRTLRLASDLKLNCRGHRLTPRAEGVLDDPRTPANEFEPSVPAAAILLHGATGVKLQSCVIEGFDFGILVLDTKTPAGLPDGEVARRRNKILGNRISVRTNAIGLTRADNTLIADNRLTYASERGRGVVVEFDSDENEISGNTIVSTDAASTGLVKQTPGGFDVVGQTAILDNEIHFLLGDRPLRNLVVDGELIQIQAADGTRDPRPAEADIDDSGRPDHNAVIGNVIFDAGRGNSCTRDPDTECRTDADCVQKGVCLLKQNSGIGFNLRAGETVVRGNSLSGRMERGLSFGGTGVAMTQARWYPGSCSGDPTGERLCVDDTDCNIPALPGLGTCVGVGAVTFNGNSVGLAGESNTLDGSFDNAALFANNTAGYAFRGNAARAHAETSAGISIMQALEGAVERNVVSAAANALLLGRPGAAPYVIRLNDFSGYTTAIRTADTFTVAAALGGNYWGVPCPGLDPALVRFASGAPNPNVTDVSYPVPVASTPGDQLPPPCP